MHVGLILILGLHPRLSCQYFTITIHPKTDNGIVQVLKATRHFLLLRLTDKACIVVMTPLKSVWLLTK